MNFERIVAIAKSKSAMHALIDAASDDAGVLILVDEPELKALTIHGCDGMKLTDASFMCTEALHLMHRRRE